MAMLTMLSAGAEARKRGHTSTAAEDLLRGYYGEVYPTNAHIDHHNN